MNILDWVRPSQRIREKYSEFEHSTFGPLKFNSGDGWFGWPVCEDCFHGHFSIVIEGDLDGPFAGSTAAFKRLADNWLNLCKPTSCMLTQLLVQHFPDAPKCYLIRGDLWSRLRLTSMYLLRDGTATLWFQFNFQRRWEDRYVVVEVGSLAITKIQYESPTYVAMEEASQHIHSQLEREAVGEE